MATAGYSSFRKKVIYPSIRIGVSLLAVLAIGFASWLETNESVDSCTFKNSLSFHQVHLYQNISSNLTTPDSVSFGLWKTCYFYSLNCTCSPTNIKYEPGMKQDELNNKFILIINAQIFLIFSKLQPNIWLHHLELLQPHYQGLHL